MKIFMICEFFDPKLEYQENLLVQYYRKHGHDVMVVASTFESVFDYYADRHDRRAPKKEIRVDGARIVKLPYRYNILNRLRAHHPIDRYLEEFKPDLIYVHDIMLNLPDCIRYMKRHPETRMILDYHADASNSGKNWLSVRVLHGVIRRWFLDRARPYLSRIYPVVPAGADFLTEVYGVPAHEMELLPLGTDLDFARAVSASDARVRRRRELGIGDGDLAVFTGGKLHPTKRTEDLLSAFRSLDRPDVRLLVGGDVAAGDEAYRDELRAIAGDDPRIRFLGWLDKGTMYEYMAAADLAVFPASQSVLWQRALGMGLPIVVSERSDRQRGRQDVGYLNLYGNVILLDHLKPLPNQIAHAVTDLADDREKLARLSEGARRTADELLDWDKLIERTLQFNRAA